MTIEQKIMRNLIYDEDATLGKIEVAPELNKDGETIYYIKENEIEIPSGTSSFYSGVTYHAFNKKGQNVANVLVKVSHTHKVELEYAAEREFENKGNITLISRIAMKDVFENKMLDGLRTTKSGPETSIDLMEVQISPYNFASKRVAEKLGFDEYGYLEIEDYFKLKEEQSSNVKGSMKR